jgi:hypothetical protein
VIHWHLAVMVMFKIGSHFYTWTNLDCHPSFVFLLIDGLTCVQYCTQPLVEMEILVNFFASAGLEL